MSNPYSKNKKGFSVSGNKLTICFNNGAKEHGYIITPDLFDQLIEDIQGKIKGIQRVIQISPPGDLKRFWMDVRDEQIDRIDLIEEARAQWQKSNGIPYQDTTTFHCRG